MVRGVVKDYNLARVVQDQNLTGTWVSNVYFLLLHLMHSDILMSLGFTDNSHLLHSSVSSSPFSSVELIFTSHCLCQNLHSLSVSEYTFTVCVKIYITLVFWTSDIFGNPVPFWHLQLSSGVSAYIKAPHWEHGGVFGGVPPGYIRFDPPLKSWHISQMDLGVICKRPYSKIPYGSLAVLRYLSTQTGILGANTRIQLVCLAVCMIHGKTLAHVL